MLHIDQKSKSIHRKQENHHHEDHGSSLLEKTIKILKQETRTSCELNTIMKYFKTEGQEIYKFFESIGECNNNLISKFLTTMKVREHNREERVIEYGDIGNEFFIIMNG